MTLLNVGKKLIHETHTAITIVHLFLLRALTTTVFDGTDMI